MGWTVETRSASVSELHSLGLPEPVGREIRRCRPTDAALVIGSTQTEPPPSSLPIVRRRGGGGAVIVRPDEVVWIDVALPRDDVLWNDDVGRAFGWLGQVWAAALADLGVVGAQVHTGGVVCAPLCRAVCFAGLAPGEVTVAGQKAVGMSQRRTRSGALFQCSLLRRWDPAAYAEVLALPSEAASALAVAAVAFPQFSVAAVEAAFLSHLPAPAGRT